MAESLRPLPILSEIVRAAQEARVLWAIGGGPLESLCPMRFCAAFTTQKGSFSVAVSSQKRRWEDFQCLHED